ncbi:MAG: carboxypeptidase-like regulatory domain-containing protein [Bacteroidales bacterium]|nr:carboxypeptidase-like regulatory domain-containing protein [Bacteroidales bacterium]
MPNKNLSFILSLLLWLLPWSALAQMLTVSGTVRDDRQQLAFASVTIKGSTLGTITNEDGYFSLKIPYTENEISIVVSHVGYRSSVTTQKASEAHDLKIYLKPHFAVLSESLVLSMDAEEIVREALQMVKKNYPSTPISQCGFYRETVKKGNKYLTVSEAVIDIFKWGYSRDVIADRVSILKGRRLVNQRADTLTAKLQGGPNLALNLDVVKNYNDLFYPEDLSKYHYTMDTPTVIDQKDVYVINMTPRFHNDMYPLYYAKLYIDKESLAIMRAEYRVDMEKPDLVTTSILRRKPAGLKFSPQEVSFIASYRKVGDLTVLHYVRESMRFKCTWKKRFFNSTYSIVSEMVATDIKTEDVEQIPLKYSFRSKDIFEDKVDDFSDPDFWGDYNILEPSESLEHAVDRLRKRR